MFAACLPAGYLLKLTHTKLENHTEPIPFGSGEARLEIDDPCQFAISSHAIMHPFTCAMTPQPPPPPELGYDDNDDDGGAGADDDDSGYTQTNRHNFRQ